MHNYKFEDLYMVSSRSIEIQGRARLGWSIRLGITYSNHVFLRVTACALLIGGSPQLLASDLAKELEAARREALQEATTLEAPPQQTGTQAVTPGATEPPQSQGITEPKPESTTGAITAEPVTEPAPSPPATIQGDVLEPKLVAPAQPDPPVSTPSATPGPGPDSVPKIKEETLEERLARERLEIEKRKAALEEEARRKEIEREEQKAALELEQMRRKMEREERAAKQKEERERKRAQGDEERRQAKLRREKKREAREEERRQAKLKRERERAAQAEEKRRAKAKREEEEKAQRQAAIEQRRPESKSTRESIESDASDAELGLGEEIDPVDGAPGAAESDGEQDNEQGSGQNKMTDAAKKLPEHAKEKAVEEAEKTATEKAKKLLDKLFKF